MSITIKDIHAGSRDVGVMPAFRFIVKDVTADNAYPAGGYPVTPAMFGLTTIVGIIPCPTPDGAHVAFDPTTSKLKFLLTGSALSGKFAESGSSGVSGSVARLLILGT